MSFYFAWAGPAETTFGLEHQVEDETVFGFEIGQDEGDFAFLTVDIKNPRVGLLAPGRDLWVWFSHNGDVVTPLFYGRLVGMPEQIVDEAVRLTFTARPSDFDAQKRALADALRVAPYYDPVWIAEESRDDPDAVLEGYNALWDADRVTHLVTASNSNTGEDGTVDFAGGFFYDSLSVSYGAPPARSIAVEAEVFWDQVAVGSVDISESLIAAFKTAGTSKKSAITSFTGEGLMRDWPEEGKRIGAGWEVGTSKIERTDGKVVAQDYQQVVMTNGKGQFPIWTMKPTFLVNYDVSRARSEKVTFTIHADVQALVTEAGDEENLLLTLASQDVGSPIDPLEALPIGDLKRRAYFPTDRGRDSLAVLISIARARLLARARAVDVSFAIPFEDALALSCRKNAAITDDRLPGGTAAGKIIAYRMACNGDSGALSAGVTIGCTIGKGNTVSTVPGAPVYVAAGYVEEGYQLYAGKTVMPIAGEITFTEYGGTVPNDDGIDFFAMTPANVVTSMTVINGEAVQRAALKEFKSDLAHAIEALNAVYTEVDMDLLPLTGGPFATDYAIVVSDLMVPSTINLEAA